MLECGGGWIAHWMDRLDEFLDAYAWALPTPLSAKPSEIFRRHCVISFDPGERTMGEEVEQSIRLLMPAGRANVGAVADALGTNVRTLQRRLDVEGTSFSELLDRVRVQLVSQHFANRRLRLTDVAHLLGYSTLASFSARYRGRFEETPTRARRRQWQPEGRERLDGKWPVQAD